jgi:hypothetical protein
VLNGLSRQTLWQRNPLLAPLLLVPTTTPSIEMSEGIVERHIQRIWLSALPTANQ